VCYHRHHLGRCSALLLLLLLLLLVVLRPATRPKHHSTSGSTIDAKPIVCWMQQLSPINPAHLVQPPSTLPPVLLTLPQTWLTGEPAAAAFPGVPKQKHRSSSAGTRTSLEGTLFASSVS